MELYNILFGLSSFYYFGYFYTFLLGIFILGNNYYEKYKLRNSGDNTKLILGNIYKIKKKLVNISFSVLNSNYLVIKIVRYPYDKLNYYYILITDELKNFLLNYLLSLIFKDEKPKKKNPFENMLKNTNLKKNLNKMEKNDLDELQKNMQMFKTLITQLKIDN